MTSEAEHRLNELGLQIEEYDFGREDEPDVMGLVVFRWLDSDRYSFKACIRPGSAAEDRASFAEWTLDRLFRMVEHGHEPDGWQRRESDGGWQLWARTAYLPSID